MKIEDVKNTIIDEKKLREVITSLEPHRKSLFSSARYSEKEAKQLVERIKFGDYRAYEKVIDSFVLKFTSSLFKGIKSSLFYDTDFRFSIGERNIGVLIGNKLPEIPSTTKMPTVGTYAELALRSLTVPLYLGYALKKVTDERKEVHTQNQDKADSYTSKVIENFREKLPFLEACASAGDVAAISKLISIYGQEKVNITVGEKLSVKSNPLFDIDKVNFYKEARGFIASSGERTKNLEPEAFDRWMREFFFDRAKTPEDYYNVGYALLFSENEDIRNETLGVDYLKLAMNQDNANAAYMLGNYYLEKFYYTDMTRVDIFEQSLPLAAKAQFYYNIAEKMGHPFAKWDPHDTYINKYFNASDVEKYFNVPPQSERQPSDAFIIQHPEAVHVFELKPIDLSSLLDFKSKDGHIERLLKAEKHLDAQMKDYNLMVAGIETQLKLDQEELQGGAMTAAWNKRYENEVYNAVVTKAAQEKQHELESFLARKKKAQRTYFLVTAAMIVATPLILGTGGAILGAAIPGGMLAGAAADAASKFGIAYGAGRVLLGLGRTAAINVSTDDKANEIRQAIAYLQSTQKDLSLDDKQIAKIADHLKKLRNSQAGKEIERDESKKRQILDGLIWQSIISDAALESITIDWSAKAKGYNGIDDFLKDLHQTDKDLHAAVFHLCCGVASPEDIQYIMSATNVLQRQGFEPNKAEQTAIEIGEMVQDDIGAYLTRANFIDCLEKNGLDVQLGKGFSNCKIDPGILSTLGLCFSNLRSLPEDVKRSIDFAFGPSKTRHGEGRHFYTSHLARKKGELPQPIPRRVQTLSEQQENDFMEYARELHKINLEEYPEPGAKFVELCAYNFLLGQGLSQEEVNGIQAMQRHFDNNPDGPAGYLIVNRTIQAFTKQMGFESVEDMQKLPEPMQAVIAETYLDFFLKVGQERLGDKEYEMQKAVIDKLKDKPSYIGKLKKLASYIVETDLQHRFEEFSALLVANLEMTIAYSTYTDAKTVHENLPKLSTVNVDIKAPDDVERIKDGVMLPNFAVIIHRKQAPRGA